MISETSVRVRPVVHAAVDVEGELVDLACRDQGGDGHQAAVARREVGPPPQIAEQDAVGVAGERRRRAAHLGLDGGRARGARWPHRRAAARSARRQLRRVAMPRLAKTSLATPTADTARGQPE